MVDKTLAGMEEYDPFREALPLAFSNSAKKRRRDQDTKEAVTRRLLVEKRGSGSGGWGAILAVPKTTAWDWRTDFIAECFAAAWKSIGNASAIAAVGDGGRAGEPPKEYFFGAVYNCDDHVACWGRPHVRCFVACECLIRVCVCAAFVCFVFWGSGCPTCCVVRLFVCVYEGFA